MIETSQLNQIIPKISAHEMPIVDDLSKKIQNIPNT